MQTENKNNDLNLIPLPETQVMLRDRKHQYIPAYLVEVIHKRNHWPQMRFYCPYCKGFHTHGLAELKPNKLTHRSPHCTNDLGRYVAHKYGYYLYYTHTREEIKNYKKTTSDIYG